MENLRIWNEDDLKALYSGNFDEPHDLLGFHKLAKDGEYIIRILNPSAKEITIISLEDESAQYHMAGTAANGFFEYIFTNLQKPFAYKLACVDDQGNRWEYIDPYQFNRTITSDDLYLFGIGKDYKLYEKLGAHYITVNGIKGVRFLVWAPHAKRVSVVGPFNNWDGRRNMMSKLQNFGVWEIFIPGLASNESYRLEIKTQKDVILYKADPYANYYEVRPNNASVLFEEGKYTWNDKDWMDKRQEGKLDESPMSIYEVHIGSWKRHEDGSSYTYVEAANELAAYVKDMGYTHVELMGIMEHPFDGSWGYQVTGYFAPTSRYGNPDEFKKFVDIMHANGIGVILDWVPAHFPKDAFALEKFDGEALYESPDDRKAYHPHWGTLIFDYSNPQVSLFLIASALSWLERYHIDGLRVDAVASMLYLDYGRDGNYVPNKFGGKENLEAIEFLKHLNEVVYSRVPGATMIAEESTAWPKVSHPVSDGGLGFGFKWNMGWMNDFLSYMRTPDEYRTKEHGKITFSLMYAFSENFIQVLSHDEVVHEKQCMLYKMPGDMPEKYANLKTAYAFLFLHPGKKMLFMGNELAATKEWNEKAQLQWELLNDPNHKGVQDFVRELNKLYKSQNALWEVSKGFENFEWIDCENSEQKVISFVRKGKDFKDDLVVVVNFSKETWNDFRVGVPHSGIYQEILNSDSSAYAGTNNINKDAVLCDMKEWQYRKQSMKINLAPFSVSVFKLKEALSPEQVLELQEANDAKKDASKKTTKTRAKAGRKTAKKEETVAETVAAEVAKAIEDDTVEVKKKATRTRKVKAKTEEVKADTATEVVEEAPKKKTTRTRKTRVKTEETKAEATKVEETRAEETKVEEVKAEVATEAVEEAPKKKATRTRKTKAKVEEVAEPVVEAKAEKVAESVVEAKAEKAVEPVVEAKPEKVEEPVVEVKASEVMAEAAVAVTATTVTKTTKKKSPRKNPPKAKKATTKK